MSTVVRGLTFSKALLGLQAGERLQREGWNGKNMWIALGAGSTALPAEKFWNPHARQFAESNGGFATVDDYFIMKTAQGTIQMGWVPSQADMLAADWQTLVDEPKEKKDIGVIHVLLGPSKDIAEQIKEAIKKMIGEPTIGRRVWYWPSSFDKGRLQIKPDTIIQQGDPNQACDAGIVYVHSDTMINVTVADHNGNMHKRTSVPLLGFDDPKPQDNAYCTWMDYQVQQAKIVETVQSELIEPVADYEEFTSGEGASS